MCLGPGALLQVLRQIQARFHHIPAWAIDTLATQWQ